MRKTAFTHKVEVAQKSGGTIYWMDVLKIASGALYHLQNPRAVDAVHVETFKILNAAFVRPVWLMCIDRSGSRYDSRRIKRGAYFNNTPCGCGSLLAEPCNTFLNQVEFE